MKIVMRNFCIVLALCTAFLSFSQEKYIDKQGSIDFEASVAAFEEVAAKNKTASAVLNSATGEFAALALMKAFRFKVALMEEHFNENYVDSDQYPKAVFRGTVENFNLETLNAQVQNYTLNGSLSLHGKTVAVTTPVKIKTEAGIIYLNAAFKLNPQDFEIKIPKIVRKKIAESVNVHVAFALKKK